MSDWKIINQLKQFVVKNADAMDRALNHMSIDIIRLSDAQVPVGKTGALASSHKSIRNGFMSYKVEYNMKYAAYQEFGKWPDGSHIILKHTKPGTKTFYLRDPGDQITSQALDYFKREINTIPSI